MSVIENVLNYLIVIFFILISQTASADIIKNITIENYTNFPLLYLTSIYSYDSNINLPLFVSKGSEGSFSKATGTIILKTTSNGLDQAKGSFIIGYDSQHYCLYHYSYDKKNNTWFMYAANTNLTHISCPVDVDAHTFIVFQRMGK